jgi:two-component system, OmpR family, phosphate regulon response regulator PhoB
MANCKILIVEDEAPIREMIAFHLRRAGYDILQAENSHQARELLVNERPDVALVDWMLPDMSGLELTRLLKRDDGNDDLAVIMLTARAHEHDKVTGLDAGADDYVTKPFSPRELVARIQAVLRRTRTGAAKAMQVGRIELDSAAYRVTVDGDELKLGPTEYRLLKFLATHAERVYSRAQLLDRVWGANVYVEERTVDVHIRRLRMALTPFGCENYIQTVRSAGYRFSLRATNAQ